MIRPMKQLAFVAFVLFACLVSQGNCQTVVVDSDGKEVRFTPEQARAWCVQIEPIEPNLRLKANARIRGTIKDQTGAPFSNSPVELRLFISQEKQEAVRKSSTDAAGSFDLKVVKPGEYRLLLSPHRGFKQPTKLECSSEDCNLQVVLIANPSDQPTTNCPLR
jgi:hypothetical protein